MSRVIKFRAWDADRKRMHTTPKWVEFKVNASGELSALNYNFVGKEVLLPLMQFTGLYDANGVEIYEGDIVEYNPYHNLGHSYKKEISSVIWGETGDSDGWSHGKHYEWIAGQCSLADIADSDYKDEAYCKVIGNIYEHPEILK
jgi:uncharacterized phage protein (TIGR01671 family)